MRQHWRSPRVRWARPPVPIPQVRAEHLTIVHGARGGHVQNTLVSYHLCIFVPYFSDWNYCLSHSNTQTGEKRQNMGTSSMPTLLLHQQSSSGGVQGTRGCKKRRWRVARCRPEARGVHQCRLPVVYLAKSPWLATHAHGFIFDLNTLRCAFCVLLSAVKSTQKDIFSNILSFFNNYIFQ